MLHPLLRSSPVSDAGTESASDPICYEYFDSGTPGWAVASSDAPLSLEFPQRKASILLRAWCEPIDDRLTDDKCPGLDCHLERLYGLRSVGGTTYSRKRAASPSTENRDGKRRRASALFPATPVKAASQRDHSWSSPGPTVDEESGSNSRRRRVLPYGPPLPQLCFTDKHDACDLDEVFPSAPF